METFGDIWKHARILKIFWDIWGIFRDIWRHTQKIGDVWKKGDISRIILRSLETFGDTWKHLKVWKIGRYFGTSLQVFEDNWLISVNTTGTHTSIVFFQCIILECGMNINNRLGPRRKRTLYTQSSHLEIYTHVYRFVRTAPDSPAQLHDTMHRTPKQRISPPTARTA